MGRFDDISTFVQVVDSGSFTAAAERLSIAKSAASRRVADLETRLGAQLLQRTTRRLHLTETGRDFYERAMRILGVPNREREGVTAFWQTRVGRADLTRLEARIELVEGGFEQP